MLNNLKDTDPPWVTPLPILNVRNQHLPTFDTTTWSSQKSCSSLLSFFPRPQTLSNSMHIVWSRNSYGLHMYNNSWNRGLWHIPEICCTKFSSKVAVPVTHHWLNPCRTSCRMMVEQRQLWMMEVKNFQITSTKPIPLKYPSPLGIRTNVLQVIPMGSSPIGITLLRYN